MPALEDALVQAKLYPRLTIRIIIVESGTRFVGHGAARRRSLERACQQGMDYLSVSECTECSLYCCIVLRERCE